MTLREDLRDLKPYMAGVKRPGVLKLASNENPLGPSPRALAALVAAAPQVNVYPDGAAVDLRTALAGQHGVSPDQIVVGNGSDEVLTLIAGAYIRPGDNGISADVTFSEYQFAVRLFGGTMTHVPLRDGAFDLEAMAGRIDARTRVVFVCNPNNPTGRYVTATALDAFLNRVPSTVLVVVDEAYVHYADAPDFPQALSRLADHPNLLILRTFSKVYGLASLRVGYAVASAAVAHDLSVVRQPFNVGSLSQAAATAALTDTEFVARSVAMNREGRAFWTRELPGLGLAHFPTQANFVAVHVRRDAQAVFTAMADAGVTIRALTSFGLPDWIRITIGTPEQNALCLAALRSGLDKVPESR